MMAQSLTSEQVMAMGKQLIMAHLATLPVEQLLQLVWLSPSEWLAVLPTKELVARLSIQERLADLTSAEIENYLHQRQSQNTSAKST